MMKVNTFIVGAPKAGTTSLHYYLCQHRDVCMSSVKEPNFFSFEEVSTLYYNAIAISSTSAYHQLFDNQKKIMGEASVSYLFYKDVPKRIYDYNPNAKIIIVLRNPVERAISHYLMDHRLGLCPHSMNDIFNNREKWPIYFQQFLELGLYFNQVKRYLDTFSKEQVHIVFYDDFKQGIEDIMVDLFQFLDLDNTLIDYTVQNPFMSSSNPVISFLYKISWIRKGVKKMMPQNHLKRIKSRFFSSHDKPHFTNEILDQLNTFYRADILDLELLLNTDLSRWKQE